MSVSKIRPVERRGFGRRDTSLHALIVTGGRAPVHCIVRNYSEGGALIEFKEPFVPPFRFRLVIEAKRVDVLCEICRQAPNAVGVAFVGGSSAGLFEAAQPASSAVAPAVAPPATPTRTNGADLRNSLFGVRSKEHVAEPVRRFDAGNGTYSRKF